MKGFIYIIKNTINNKVYVGQTKVSIEQRWAEHLRHAKYGKQVINRAMRKYGIDKFYVELLETCNIKDIDSREMYYIKLYNSTDKSKGYNVSIGGNTPRFERKKLNVAELADLYKRNFTLQQIAEMYEVSRYIINTELKNAGIKVRNRHESAERVSKIDKNLILEALKNTNSLRSAAKYANISYPTFRKACIYNNIEYNSPTSVRHQK